MRMRIISGIYKGRLINVPANKFIRPTTDRVRETLFNLLNNRINFNGIKVLDLYAGSGSLGLECLSRGADSVHFVEKNIVIYNYLNENIRSLGAADQCTIYRMDAVRFTDTFKNMKYDLILADPPFFKDDIYKAASNILKYELLLDEESPFVIERSVQTKEKDQAMFNKEPMKIIGDTCLYEIFSAG